ncbi:uncharacterized protein LOC101845814 [Aplysia californica]|uniref:Uncharacterized protein LOC101845814 n=1 Tax=Aplysia californica TaxID=6500 RepID=A0ABM1VTJ8_APLCA|nr:uncharacterized protein LOC101845814 [Aplysia californica]XP_005089827.1 uncharacterized protein LOC101845814 [Aplysia californica]XP_012938160.1 uncharacterized protein LOC101845814 [Aplysia californica]XP_012938161.1 uncharacterized protein LOC101845814 [Aplysia californica]XP_012938172.1 uncharacterized protein LOC101845814 [Aplysia californica]XP_035825740.1 uncharacterized protein LOC101845814 [Aplysia californica]XP_035825745.1 uncharacterized protein LOC101845814 [Aplysia californic
MSPTSHTGLPSGVAEGQVPTTATATAATTAEAAWEHATSASSTLFPPRHIDWLPHTSGAYGGDSHAQALRSAGNLSQVGVALTHGDSALIDQVFTPESPPDFSDIYDLYDFDNVHYFNSSYADYPPFYEQLIDHSAFKMRDELFRYASPVVIVLGNISNLMALFVLQRKKLRRSSVCFYLSAYAVANLCVLDFLLAVAWVCFVFQKPYVTFLADWTCRLWMFLTNVMTFSGIWFVVVMNIDRLIYLTSKTKAKSYCTAFAAKTIVIFVVIGLVVVSIHAMWTYALQPQGCFVSYQQQDLHTIIWPWWSAAVYSYIPLSLLLILNIAQAIAICLRWCQCVPFVECFPCKMCTPINSCTQYTPCARCVRSQPNSPDSSGTTPDDFVVTVMVVSLSFFLLTIPATVINILDIHLPSSALTVDLIARIELTKKITELLSTLNRTVLGYLLLACSKDFRHEFVAFLRLICCCLRSRRIFKVFEMRNMSNSEDSSPHIQVDYELCNNNDETVTDV